MRIRKGHAIRLNVNLHVFIRRRGVQCLNFDFHYQLFIKPPRAPNIRTDMRRERAFLAVRVENTSQSDSGSVRTSPSPQLMPKVETDGDSDSEVEIVENYTPLPRQSLLAKRKIKTEQSILQLPTKCLRKLPLASTFEDPIDVDMLSDSSAAASSSTAPYLPSHLSIPLTSSKHGSISPEPELVYPGLWPKNYQTWELLDGFHRMDSKGMIAKFPTVEERFLEVFEQGFHNATYYDACHRLRAMKQKDIDLSIVAKDTPEGLWSCLVKSVPLRKQ
jgi:hypothetical protein